MEQHEALELWERLGAEGKAPTDLIRATYSLPSFTVGFDSWVDRLAKRYLAGLSRRTAHFKLALAPYGGGKTHFLMSLGVEARRQNFAVSYVPCSDDVSLDKSLDLYRETVNASGSRIVRSQESSLSSTPLWKQNGAKSNAAPSRIQRPPLASGSTR